MSSNKKPEEKRRWKITTDSLGGKVYFARVSGQGI